MFGPYVGQRNPAGHRRVHAGGDFTAFRRAGKHFIVLTRYASTGQPDRNQTPPGPCRLARCNRSPADEIAFIQFGDPHQPGFHRRNAIRNLMAVERIAHFGAQHVAGGKSDRQRAVIHQFVPDFNRDAVGNIDFEAVFAGVAGARNDAVCAIDPEPGKPVVADSFQIAIHQRLQDGLRGGALQSQQRGRIRFVDNANIEAGGFSLQMRHVPEAVGGIDAKVIFVVSDFVGGDIVDKCARLIQQGGILHLPLGQLRYVIGRHILQKRQRPGACNAHLPHM